MYQFQGQQQYSGPPPAKRQKSNAVVTHYAPPPGYVPPPNAQLPPTAWQAAGYNATPYSAPPQYPQQQYGQQYPPQPYGQPYNQQQYPQQQSQQQFYPGYTPPAYPTPYQAYPGYQQPNGWQQPQQQQPAFPYPHQPQQPISAPNSQHHGAQQHPQANFGQAFAMSPQSMTPSSDPSQLQTRQSSVSYSAPIASVSGDDVQGSTNEFDETDFSREASFAKEADSVQPELSLGIIVYYPGRPVKTALPATYDEAQAQMIDTKPRDGEDESVSRFFNRAESANFTSSVKETPNWENVKDDPIFREFPRRTDAVYTTVTRVREDRFRPDPAGEKPAVMAEQASDNPPESPVSAKVTLSDPEGNIDNEDDEAMDTDTDEEEVAPVSKADEVDTSDPKATPKATVDCLDQAGADLANGEGQSRDAQVSARGDGPAPNDKQSNSKPKSRQTSRQRSNGFQAPSGPRRNSSGYHQNDRQQHSGRPHQGHHANGQHPSKRKFSQTNGQYGPHNPPPPPDSRWNSHHRGRSGSLASNGSGHTEAGGDFEMGNNDTHETPHRHSQADQSGSGRKRGYDEMERSHGADRRRQTDDVTPRIRRGRPNVPDAYRYSRH